MRGIADALIAILERNGELERRIAGTEFRGRVKQIDAANHLVRLVIGNTPEGDEVLSPWLPVAQAAGDLKVHSMPSVGQQVSAHSPSGDIVQASVDKLHWSDGFDPPSTDADLHVLTFGDVRVELSKSALKIQVGQTIHNLTAEGLELHANHVAITGSSLEHNDVNVGSTHVHGGVTPGGADTSTPH